MWTAWRTMCSQTTAVEDWRKALEAQLTDAWMVLEKLTDESAETKANL